MHKNTITNKQFKEILANTPVTEFTYSEHNLKLLKKMNFASLLSLSEGASSDYIKENFLQPILLFLNHEANSGTSKHKIFSFEKNSIKNLFEDFKQSIHYTSKDKLLSYLFMQKNELYQDEIIKLDFAWVYSEFRQGRTQLNINSNIDNEILIIKELLNPKPLIVSENENGLMFANAPHELAAAKYLSSIQTVSNNDYNHILPPASPSTQDIFNLPTHKIIQSNTDDSSISSTANETLLLIKKKIPASYSHFIKNKDSFTDVEMLSLVKAIPAIRTSFNHLMNDTYYEVLNNYNLLHNHDEKLESTPLNERISRVSNNLTPLLYIFNAELKDINEQLTRTTIDKLDVHLKSSKEILNIIEKLNNNNEFKQFLESIYYQKTLATDTNESRNIYIELISMVHNLTPIIPLLSSEAKKCLTPIIIDNNIKKAHLKTTSFGGSQHDYIFNNTFERLPYLDAFNDDKVTLADFVTSMCHIETRTPNIDYDLLFKKNRQIPKMLLKVLKRLQISSIHNPLLDADGIFTALQESMGRNNKDTVLFFNMMEHFIKSEQSSSLSPLHDLNQDFLQLFTKEGYIKLNDKIEELGFEFMDIQKKLRLSINYTIENNPSFYKDSFKDLDTMSILLNKYPTNPFYLLSDNQDELFHKGKLNKELLNKILLNNPNIYLELRSDVQQSKEVQDILTNPEFFNHVSDPDYQVKDLRDFYSKNHSEFLYTQLKNPGYYHGGTFANYHPELLELLDEKHTDNPAFWIDLIKEEVDFNGSNHESFIIEQIPLHILSNIDFFSMVLKELPIQMIEKFPQEFFNNPEQTISILPYLKDAQNPLGTIINKMPHLDSLMSLLIQENPDFNIPRLLDQAAILLNQNFLEQATPDVPKSSSKARPMKF